MTILTISNNSYPIIIAKLETTGMRKNFIYLSKTYRKFIVNIMSSDNWSTNNKIFIYECLTQDKRILFSNTRSTAREEYDKFVRITNSYILNGKDENSEIIRSETL